MKDELLFIMNELQSMGSAKFKEGLERFGIDSSTSYGIRMPALRAFAKTVGKNHELALELWATGQHEARLLATLIAEKKKVTKNLMDTWVKDFNSWDVCDQALINLFNKTPWAHEKAIEWTGRSGEFERRAGFAMMAVLAVHDKKASAEQFERFFPYLEKGAQDDRNFVRKAINWAIRQMGKRNLDLNQKCLALCERIQQQNTSSALWISSDAIRELSSYKVQQRLENKKE